MKKLKSLFFPTILALAFGLMLSCAKSSEDNINDTVADTNDAIDEGVANTNENLEDTLEDNNDTAVDLENALNGGGGSSNSSSCNNSKASIVGNAVTEKCSRTDCPKSKIVIWDLDGCMTVVGESVMGAVDAASHNNSIYIADDAGFYWKVTANNTISKHQLNYPSGYKNSEITGISVNSIGDVYVAGMVVQNKKELTAYWKNGELVKTFSENADWYSEKNVGADSNGNVYIPGWRMKSHEVTYSALWINGTRKNLSTTHDGEATDAVIGSETASGSNVWISGAHGGSNCGSYLAGYWRRKPNGTINQVTKVTKVKTYNSTVCSSRASSIFVSGSTVYMAGAVNVVNAGDVPVYWKGKTQHELPVEFDLKTCDYCKADPTDISLLEGKVLVVGDYYDANAKVDSYYTHGENKAVYWLDKKLHKLCESCGSSYAVAVVVMD